MMTRVSLVDRLGRVSRDDVRGLVREFQTLLEATADGAWDNGVEDGAQAISGALQAEGEKAAAEAPRGVLHQHPKIGDEDARDRIEKAAGDVLARLRKLGVDDVLEDRGSDVRTNIPSSLVVRRRVDADLSEGMKRNARYFVLRYGRGVDADDAYRRLDGSPPGSPPPAA